MAGVCRRHGRTPRLYAALPQSRDRRGFARSNPRRAARRRVGGRQRDRVLSAPGSAGTGAGHRVAPPSRQRNSARRAGLRRAGSGALHRDRTQRIAALSADPARGLRHDRDAYSAARHAGSGADRRAAEAQGGTHLRGSPRRPLGPAHQRCRAQLPAGRCAGQRTGRPDALARHRSGPRRRGGRCLRAVRAGDRRRGAGRCQ